MRVLCDTYPFQLFCKMSFLSNIVHIMYNVNESELAKEPFQFPQEFCVMIIRWGVAERDYYVNRNI